MINKKLLNLDRAALRSVGCNVLCQWLGLVCNVVFIWQLASLLGAAFAGALTPAATRTALLLCVATIPARWLCTVLAARMSHKASAQVKGQLRGAIYRKLLALGTGYTDSVSTSEVVMLAGEGVEQIDTYFAKYLPQLFYSLLAPLTLFVLLAPVHLRSAGVLLACVPLIPLSIVAVQKFAKKLLTAYWGEYTTLGDSFLENIQGLTTLKVYRADEWKHKEMNAQAERFRKITMKVLTMQLNSVTLMDLLAYGGAALGIISAVAALAAGQISLAACLRILLLAADFFLPLRLLGSYFHIAMNGAASAEKIFRLLAVPENQTRTKASGAAAMPADTSFCVQEFSFAYAGGDEVRGILRDVSLEIPAGAFVALVGESGCGKSTLAGILSGRLHSYRGSACFGGAELCNADATVLASSITVVPHDALLFKGTVEENLRLAALNAEPEQLWSALRLVNLADFCKANGGLAAPVQEGGRNLSGGQRQRLALARALLHDTPVYIFDEAASNVDAESENDIMAAIHALAGEKTVILISHRLANVVGCDTIFMLEQGQITERGTHEALLAQGGAYQKLYAAQGALENWKHTDVQPAETEAGA